ncbi:hypothetical protein T03_9390 [Trichinella britovi]|uniref:Uncharacterized protein n=1 Tax=Trichinella britovi TaxID=45882 RepID=A0A0V1CME0_TRIBR|nr:hypothetical protein T03_9390 [Trichinella britovi]
MEVLEQGFQLTRRPNIYDFKTRGQAGRPSEASFAKVEETTLRPGFGKVALKSRDQGYFEIANKLRQINFDV